jgi:aspartate kinase
MRVMKFGGAALRDGNAVRQAARIVLQQGGNRPLVVVSAHEGVTALLERAFDEALLGRLEWDPIRIRHRTLLRQLELTGDFLDRYLFELRAILESIREGGVPERQVRDFVLSFGERMSARVFAAVLRRGGHSATPLDAYDLGLVTAGGLLSQPAHPRSPVGESLRCVPGIPVVTGFLALDGSGNLTTLGPNGSDLSAVWFGEAAGADEIQLWKNVPGVMTADPKLVPYARRIPALGWAEAAELTAHGSEVVHPGALELARRAGLPLRVLDVERPTEEGTRIEGGTRNRRLLALAHRRNVALLRIPIDLGRDRGEELAATFRVLADEGLEPYLSRVMRSEQEVLVADMPALEARTRRLTGCRIEGGLASLTIVGRELGEDESLLTTVERSAAALGGQARRAPGGTTATSQVFLVARAELAPLVGALHREWFETPSPKPDLVPWPS